MQKITYLFVAPAALYVPMSPATPMARGPGRAVRACGNAGRDRGPGRAEQARGLGRAVRAPVPSRAERDRGPGRSLRGRGPGRAVRAHAPRPRQAGPWPPPGRKFTYRNTSSFTRRCWVRLSPIAQNSRLLPPVGV